VFPICGCENTMIPILEVGLQQGLRIQVRFNDKDVHDDSVSPAPTAAELRICQPGGQLPLGRPWIIIVCSAAGSFGLGSVVIARDISRLLTRLVSNSLCQNVAGRDQAAQDDSVSESRVINTMLRISCIATVSCGLWTTLFSRSVQCLLGSFRSRACHIHPETKGVKIFPPVLPLQSRSTAFHPIPG
jgi:hypothetical protein